MAGTPSSEILMAIPAAKDSKKYTTYLGHIDSVSSGSLINQDIVRNFEVQPLKKPAKWDTATGILLTRGKVTMAKCCLSQFTRKHLFEKCQNDKYDIDFGTRSITSYRT